MAQLIAAVKLEDEELVLSLLRANADPDAEDGWVRFTLMSYGLVSVIILPWLQLLYGISEVLSQLSLPHTVYFFACLNGVNHIAMNARTVKPPSVQPQKWEIRL